MWEHCIMRKRRWRAERKREPRKAWLIGKMVIRKEMRMREGSGLDEKEGSEEKKKRGELGSLDKFLQC